MVGVSTSVYKFITLLRGQLQSIYENGWSSTKIHKCNMQEDNECNECAVNDRFSKSRMHMHKLVLREISRKYTHFS